MKETSKSVLSWIERRIEIESNPLLTYEEWCDIRRNGTPDEIAEAAERMMAQGGYDCLA